ncbi:MAG: trypsin-like serine protease [Bdellovibrionota bacterium]
MLYQFFVIVFAIAVLCAQKSQAIVNGKELLNSQRPEVVRLILYKDKDSLLDQVDNGRCTGTAISDSLVLTAGHCVTGNFNEEKNNTIVLHRFKENKTEEIISVLQSYTEFIPEDLQKIKDEQNKHGKTTPGCSPGEKPMVLTKTPDLALLKFPNKTFRTWAQINFQKIHSAGDSIEFLGYGMTASSFEVSIPFSDPQPNDLRLGKSKIWRTGEKRFAIISQYLDPIGDIGDSGAPVFDNGQVTAVLSTLETKCETEYGEDYAIMNTAVALSSIEAIKFFSKALNKLEN